MGPRRPLVLTGPAVALLLGTGAWAVLHAGDPAARPGDPAGSAADVSRIVPGEMMHVESGVPTTTFLPLGPRPQDGRTLSAQRAYNLLVSDSAKLQLIPATVQAYYGVLTDASASPPARHTRVWAFTTMSGCLVSRGVPTPPSTQRCRIWEFVNARSGHDVGVISQEVLPG